MASQISNLEERASKFSPNELFEYAIRVFSRRNQSLSFMEVYERLRDITRISQRQCAEKWGVSKQAVSYFIKNHQLREISIILDLDAIIKAHKTYDGRADEAAKHLPYSQDQLKYHWKKANLEFKRKHPLPDEEIEKIHQTFVRFGNKIQPTAEATGHCPKIIEKYVLKKGLKIRKERCLAQNQIDEIRKVYDECKSIREAAKRLGYSHTTIRRYAGCNCAKKCEACSCRAGGS